MAFNAGEFSPKQKDVMANCAAMLNLLEGAVRSGKTICSIIAFIMLILTNPSGNVLLVGKTDRTLFRNVLKPIEEMIGSDHFTFRRGTGEGEIFGRRFYTAGAIDERSYTKIQGLTLALAYGDEVASWPESFFQMLISRLSDPGARFIGTMNPEGPYHWMKTKFLEREHELSLESWHFTLEDNYNLDPAYVENLKKFYTGLYYKRYILGQWVFAEGVIYDMFSEARHVSTVDPNTWNSCVIKHVSCDYGTSNPTVFQMWGHDGIKRYLKKEYYYDSKEHGRQKTDSEYAQDLSHFIGLEEIQTVIIDPSAASFKLEVSRLGIPVQDADNSVLDGIREVCSELSQDYIQVDPACVNYIREKSGYVWDTKAGERGEDKPIKQNDHSCDCERYYVFTVKLNRGFNNLVDMSDEVGYNFATSNNYVGIWENEA